MFGIQGLAVMINPLNSFVAVSLAALAFSSGHVSAQNPPSVSSRYVQSALVHSVAPARARQSLPIIMVPGHHLSSSIYLTTPDGRDGWATLFANGGYEVHVINDPSFDFSRDPEAPKAGQPPQDPNAFKPWDRDIWPRWGFGMQEGEPFPNTQFPTEAFDQFEADYPWVSTTRRDFPAAIEALLEEVGPAILIAHSAGGPSAVNAAMQRPDLVAGIVLVEPTGPPTSAHFPTLAGKSMLGVYGDYIALRGQTGRKDATEAAAALFSQHGGHGEILDLVEDRGVAGNSHLMMQDRNNDFIASEIMDWLAEHVSGKPPGRPGRGGMVGGKGKGKAKGGKGRMLRSNAEEIQN